MAADEVVSRQAAPAARCRACGQPLKGIEARLRSEIIRALDDSTYTQKWLAAQVGVTQKHMSQMLTGRVSINLALAETMLAALGRTVAVEFEDSGVGS